MIKSLRNTLIVALMATLLTGALSAQEDPSLIHVRIVEVVPGKVNEFVALQKTLMEAQKMAGLPGRSVWQESRGNTNTFHIVNSAENFAELDESATSIMSDTAWANWVNSITEVTQSREIITLRTFPDLDLGPFDNQETDLLRLMQITLKPGHSDEYANWLRNTMTPALKKHGVKGRSVNRVVVGGNTNRWVIGNRFSDWSKLDTPGSFNNIPKEERQEVFAELDEIEIEESKTLILHYRSDLSY